MPREVVPIASVISTCIHLVIQILLLLCLALASGLRITAHWFWIPLVWGLEIVFVCGLVLFTSCLNVFIRDTRYVVESVNTVLFWLVPVFYDFSMIPARFRDVYQFNPIAALVLAMRSIVLEASAPPKTLLWKLALVSVVSFAGGHLVFDRLKRRFYEYL
jgi:ABC-type polysaccharide/polyol phosphate export permease